ncbi:hypothetical protein G7Z17_g7988 [Cylindrodendrum hubeiense]|uniref:Rhodopsin domain-containing protein n=1 Tax=Cylindrodendrum hubeiense TaxID=595255 RepID=A0A9P5H7Z6_9HYPO|nr:hypothetical protein G7Z17_g7988 [Cylindrodendrum hubeiense]
MHKCVPVAVKVGDGGHLRHSREDSARIYDGIHYAPLFNITEVFSALCQAVARSLRYLQASSMGLAPQNPVQSIKLPRAATRIQCYSSAAGESPDNSTVAEFCGEDGFWAKSRDCVLDDCSVMDRLWVNEVQRQTCSQPKQTREKRFYYLLAAEVPAWICPWLRLFSGWRSLEGVRLDDYVMFGCWALYTAYTTCVHIVFDIDASEVDRQGVLNGLKILFVADKLALLCIGLAKASIVYFYLKTFTGTRFRIVAYSTLTLILVPTLVFVLVFTFQCSPVSYAWGGWSDDDGGGGCLDVRLLSCIKLGFDIGQSIVLLIIPLPLFRQFDMHKRVTLGSAVMFALGGLAVAMAGLRLRCVIIQETTTDQPWEYADRLIWTGIEISALIILACAPSIWKLLVPVAASNIPTFTPRRNPSRLIKNKALAPINTKSTANSSVSRKPSKGPYCSTKDTRSESELELDLQLGDKTRGDVWTQIKGGHRFSGFSMISHMGDRLGIRVKTTTTTRVESGDSDGDDGADEGRLVTPRPGPLSP